ncbi:MAG: hypothetical protein COT00_04600 [Candidatus Omnitrophica bacterium CG07_land_8_20_14_0_80_50_8]|nr:MAG: hypothetical protein COT00_04600 [Candidatus Omnitrophica bacterium CG07_land_8_20_14_0_80_50_8]
MKKRIFEKSARRAARVASVFFLIIFFAAPPLFSLTGEGGSLQFGAQNDPAIGLVIHVFPETAGGVGGEVTQMNFGTLQEFTNPSTGGKTLRSAVGFLVMLYPQGTTAPYHLDCSGAALTGLGGVTLPPGACAVKAGYSASDQCAGCDVGVGTVNPSGGTWIPGYRIYDSDARGYYQAIQAHLAITDDPSAGASGAVKIDQPSGSYNGTVTFTLTQ